MIIEFVKTSNLINSVYNKYIYPLSHDIICTIKLLDLIIHHALIIFMI
jgi:hypothetical protein